MGGLGVGLGRSGGAGGRPGALAFAWLESTCSKNCLEHVLNKQSNNKKPKEETL